MMKATSTLLVLIPLLCAACDPSEGGAIDFSDIFGGHHDHGGPSDPHDPPEPPGTGGAGGGTAPEELLRAIAMTRAQRDALSDAYWEEVEAETGSVTSVTSGGGFEDEPDPNELILSVSDIAVLGCGIYPLRLPCGGHRTLSLTLPVAYQQVGVYNFDDPGLHGSVTFTGEAPTPGSDSCVSGGGTMIGSGTLEILAIDSAEVRFRVTAGSPSLNSDVGGEHTAPRCP
ncbi:hypothetical protein [Sorangium sp. So ce1182]|uniref:hypothetical protein n=1 Tax=Sorangium sp. So ce1182 TaxID=3133334 RepID=UPI003F6380F8